MELLSWMNVFNRPMLDQLFYYFAIFIALYCGIKSFKCLQALPDYIRMTHYVAKLPQLTNFPVLNYFRYFPYAYKFRNEVPSIAYVFQMMCGVCQAYPKTGFFNVWLITRSVILLYKAETVEVIKERKSLYLKKMTEKSHGNRETCENDTASDVMAKRNKRKLFLELLLEFHFQDPSFMEEDMKDEVNAFMFAGHDTTATAASWALYNIGLHPNIQEKIIEELDTIFEGDNERSVTLDDIKSMKFLDRVLKESMRLYPPVPFFMREITEDVAIDGNIIRAGCMAFIFPWILHRDPEVYPLPEVFDPDRFLPENCAGRHPYAYVPFSAGPRNCIGQRFAQMEEKILLSQVLRRFTIKSLDTPDKVVVIPDLVLRCLKPLRIKFTPRVMQQ